MEFVIETLKEVLLVVALGVLSVGALYATQWIQSTRRSLEVRAENELIRAIIERTERLALATVEATEATVAKMLRQAVKEGKEDREELLALGRQAVHEVMESIGQEAREVLDEVFGDAKRYIEKLVELYVERLKGEMGN